MSLAGAANGADGHAAGCSRTSQGTEEGKASMQLHAAATEPQHTSGATCSWEKASSLLNTSMHAYTDCLAPCSLPAAGMGRVPATKPARACRQGAAGALDATAALQAPHHPASTWLGLWASPPSCTHIAAEEGTREIPADARSRQKEACQCAAASHHGSRFRHCVLPGAPPAAPQTWKRPCMAAQPRREYCYL